MELITDSQSAIRAIVAGAREKRLYVWLQADTPDDATILGRLPFKVIWSERGDFNLVKELQANRRAGLQSESMKTLVKIPSTIDGRVSFEDLVPVVFTRGENYQYQPEQILTRKDRSNRDEQLLELTEMVASGVIMIVGGGDMNLWHRMLLDELLSPTDPVLPDTSGLRVILVALTGTGQLSKHVVDALDPIGRSVLVYAENLEALVDECIQTIEAEQAEIGNEFTIQVRFKGELRKYSIDDLLNGTSRRLTEDYYLITSASFDELDSTRFESVFRQLLSDAEPVWEGYQAGFHFERQYNLSYARQKPHAFLGNAWDDLVQKSLFEVTRSLLERSSELRENYTITLPAEPGAGSTTLVRQVAFQVARFGFPVFVAKPSIADVDYWQLTGFLTDFWRKVSSTRDLLVETSCLLVFDEELAGELKVGDIARRLEHDGRNVVVLRVVPDVPNRDYTAANGRNLVCESLKSAIDREEATALYRHLVETTRRFSPELVPKEDAWEKYLKSTGEGKAFFWVCLRYFIFEQLEIPNQGGTKDTITRKFSDTFAEMVHDAPRAVKLLCFVSVCTTFRISLSGRLLCELAKLKNQEMRELTGLIGERMKYVRIDIHGQNDADHFLSLNHRLFARLIIELICPGNHASATIRVIDADDPFGLEGKFVDPGYPVELLAPMLSKLDPSKPHHRRFAEMVAVEVLKIGKEKYVSLSQANRMLQAFCYIPLLLLNGSPTILQARAITGSKSCNFMKQTLEKKEGEERSELESVIIQRFKQADSDIKAALELLESGTVESSEDPRVLKTTLANVYVAWSTFERSLQDMEESKRISTRAAALYDEVLADWPDSAYARYGLARLLFGKCNEELNLDAGAQNVEFLERALAALDMEPDSTFRDEWVTLQSDILDKLDSDQYRSHIESLITGGHEIGFIIKARRLYQRSSIEHLDLEALEEAIELLRQANKAPCHANNAQNRPYLLYLCLTLHPKQKWNFPERYKLLAELDRVGFHMPLSVRHSYATLCFQMDREVEGTMQFSKVRSVQVHQAVQIDDLGHWREPVLSFLGEKPAIRVTSMQVIAINPYGGWVRVQGLKNTIPFSQRQPWARTLNLHLKVACSVIFSKSGPRAVPPERGEKG